MSAELSWLPLEPEWERELAALKLVRDADAAWAGLQRLAKCQLDYVQAGRLDRAAEKLRREGLLREPAVRVALLGSSTLKHLVPSVRVAAMRRGMRFEIFEGEYGQYVQELLEGQELRSFRPECVCLALDAHHLAELMQDGVDAALDRIRLCWRAVKELGAVVVQQTALPVLEEIFGSNEHRLAESAAARLAELNVRMRAVAEEDEVALLAVDKYVALGGVEAWHDPALWHLAKQEVHPVAAELWGDLLARVIAAQRGRSAKCLVLDLDNTLWGGVIGDDGLEGIVLRESHAAGEAYLAFQRYVLALKRRGVVLAVCSKNEEAVAREPFERHAEMLLGVDDIACFVANWKDKATNLREIAARLRLGLEALVFVDDNPAERELVRRELPEVMVPEMPADPAEFASCIARAGYFEGVAITEDDRRRAEQYRANTQRETAQASVTDLHGYLAGLQMRAVWRPFTEDGLARIVQLTNKTNQFNLTTQRVNEAEVRAWMADPAMATMEVRLEDRFGDNGVVSLVVGRMENAEMECAASKDMKIVLWLMSCRVLGRRLEEAVLNVVVEEGRRLGAARLVGVYRPTAKNAMVRELFGRLGFAQKDKDAEGGSRWALEVGGYAPRQTEIQVERGLL
jgi:FkbH-like protein